MGRKVPFNFFYLYYFGLLVLVVGMPLSAALMSNAQVVLLLAWLLHGDLKNKMHSFFHNRTALLLTSLLLLHLAGMLYTSDTAAGWHDIKIKIPLLLPLIISTMPPLDEKKFRWLLYTFCASVFIGTMVGSALLLGFGKQPILDVRQISPFISHIRFSLMICLGVFILAYYARIDRSVKRNIAYFLLMAWFIVFMVLLESLTGLIILFTVGIVLLTYFILKRRKILVTAVYLLIIASCLFGAYAFIHDRVNKFYEIHETADLKHLDSLSAHGHPYLHDLKNNTIENGYYTGIYQCWEELESSWNKRSGMDFLGYDKKGNQIRFTVIRYLTSKGLRKDEDAVNSLSKEEIGYIENGIPDVRYLDMPTLSKRIDGIIWEFNEYKRGKDPSGHSVIQRLEFWHAAVGIIQKHWLAGVGTGDADEAFREEYISNGTQLKEKYRLRSHDQFLAIGVAFGIPGLAWFLFTLFYPLTLKEHRRDLLYITFFMISFLSMINEDTLETQAGVTFFAFFNTLFLFGRKKDSDTPVKS